MAKVYCLNENYNGISASVMFVGGEGETDDPHLLSWFKQHGYRVEESREAPPIPPELEGLEADDLKAYAEAHNIPIGNASSKNGILKKIMEAMQKQGE